MSAEHRRRLRRHLPVALLAALIAVYLALAVPTLAESPPLHGDEAWQGSTAWKLATDGVFGSDMHTGLYGAEQRYYGFLPLHPLLQAVSLRMFGLDVVPLRIVSVGLTVLTLLLTYLLGARLFGRAVGLLAAALLLMLPLNGTTTYLPTGILLFDVSRVARYDVIVPVFGLAALLAYLAAAGRGRTERWRPVWFIGAGVLAGLAGLGHLYGVVWLPILLVLAVWDRAGRAAVGGIVAGFALAWLPYVAYVLPHLPDWQGQVRVYGERFRLFDPGFYLGNLLNEPRRYGPGLGPPGLAWLARVGLWSAVVAVPLSLLVLFRRGLRGDRAARAIVVPAVIIPVLFGLLIWLKLANYLATLVPILALAAAWGVVTLWRRLREGRLPHVQSPRRRAASRTCLAAIGVLVALEAGARYRGIVERPAGPGYASVVDCLRAAIPQGATVLGDHRHWLGLSEHPYRAWYTIVTLANERQQPVPGSAMAAELDALDPDVVLVDGWIRDAVANATAGDANARAIVGWLGQHGYHRRALVDVAPYGQIEVYGEGGETGARCPEG